MPDRYTLQTKSMKILLLYQLYREDQEKRFRRKTFDQTRCDPTHCYWGYMLQALNVLYNVTQR